MRHSELKNDLHFSRIKVFSGDPFNVIPDFVDQILTSSATNRVYRATGTTAGQLVELVPQVEQRVIFDEAFPEPMSQTQLLVRVDQNRIYRANGILHTDWLEIVGADGGGSGGGSSAISVGTNPPQNAPDLLGQQYFDSRNGHLFIAIADGANLIWRNTTPPVTVSEVSLSADLSAYPDASGYWHWIYVDHLLTGFQNVFFDNFYAIDAGTDLVNAIAQYGAGCYGLFFNVTDPNSEISSYSVSASLSFLSQGNISSFSPDSSCFEIGCTINGIESRGFYISPDRRLGATLQIYGQLNI
jgi:hypothetical protein